MTATPKKNTSPKSLDDLLGKENKSNDGSDVLDNPTTTDSTTTNGEPTTVESDEDHSSYNNLDGDDNPEYVEDAKNDPFLSPHVVSTVPNRTPDELSTESADETAARYGIDQKITDEDVNNPRVQVYKDTHVGQVPSGTHLHPDIARDLKNRGISENTTDSAQVKRTVTETYDFAPDADHNDKFDAPVKKDRDSSGVKADFDRSDDYNDNGKYDKDGNLRNDQEV